MQNEIQTHKSLNFRIFVFLSSAKSYNALSIYKTNIKGNKSLILYIILEYLELNLI